MGGKCIYFRKEIEEHLNKETNQSGLINDLLAQHYSEHDKTDEQIIEDVKAKIELNKKAEIAKAKLEAYQADMREKLKDVI